MPWPFKGRHSEADRNAILAFVRHCQSLIAWQQLAMELVNDGLERAAEQFAAGDELLVRSLGGVSSPELARVRMLPALEEKVRILTSVYSTHESVHGGLLTSATTHLGSKLMLDAVSVWLARGHLQLQCWTAWTQDPSIDLSERISALDSDEMHRTGIALHELNSLIQRIGLERNEFLEVNRQAFNLVPIQFSP